MKPSPASRRRPDPEGVVDAERYLRNEGKEKLDSKWNEVIGTLAGKPFTSDALDHQHLTDFAKELKTLVATLRSLHTSVIGLQWKIKKRASPPQEAVDIMQEMRDKVNELWQLSQLYLVKEKDFDVDKANKYIQSLAERGQPKVSRFSASCWTCSAVHCKAHAAHRNAER